MVSKCASLLFVIAACSSKPYTPPSEPMPLPPTGEEARESSAQPTDDSVKVIKVEPDKGPADRPTAVRILGANFRLGGGVQVRFGKAAAEVLRTSDDEIAVQAPTGTAGDVVDVTVVFAQAGEMVLRGAYTYVAAP
jgi:hypothetical protein